MHLPDGFGIAFSTTEKNDKIRENNMCLCKVSDLYREMYLGCKRLEFFCRRGFVL